MLLECPGAEHHFACFAHQREFPSHKLAPNQNRKLASHKLTCAPAVGERLFSFRRVASRQTGTAMTTEGLVALDREVFAFFPG